MNFKITIYFLFIILNIVYSKHYNIINGGKFNYYNFVSNAESLLKKPNIDNYSIYVFGLLERVNIQQNSDLDQNLMLLSKKYKTMICVVYNRCDLYDNFRANFDSIISFIQFLNRNQLLNCGKLIDCNQLKKIKFKIFANGSILNPNNIFTSIVDQKMQ